MDGRYKNFYIIIENGVWNMKIIYYICYDDYYEIKSNFFFNGLVVKDVGF